MTTLRALEEERRNLEQYANNDPSLWSEIDLINKSIQTVQLKIMQAQ